MPPTPKSSEAKIPAVFRMTAFAIAIVAFSAPARATVVADRPMPTCDIAEESRAMRDQKNQRVNRAVTWDRPWKLQSVNNICMKVLTNAVLSFSPTVGTFGAWFYTPIAVGAINGVVRNVCSDIRGYYTNTWNRTVQRARADVLNTLAPADAPGFYNNDDGGYDTPPNNPTPLPANQCSDRIDNDGDGETDFPNDLGCESLLDDTEGSVTVPPPPATAACGDGLDNDSDGRIDYPSDPGCSAPEDISEEGEPIPAACNDGVDNDGDTRTDYPADPGCLDIFDNNEIDDTPPVPLPACRDSRDNDLDGRIDFPADAGCSDPDDNSESGEPTTAQCSDGIDNDFDRRFDFPFDPDCSSPSDNSESTIYDCQDGIDNDGDGRTDYPADTGCTFFTDSDEGDSSVPEAFRAVVPGPGSGNDASKSIPASSGSSTTPAARSSAPASAAGRQLSPARPVSTPVPITR